MQLRGRNSLPQSFCMRCIETSETAIAGSNRSTDRSAGKKFTTRIIKLSQKDLSVQVQSAVIQ